MSLLLDAIKKAESRRQTDDAGNGSASPSSAEETAEEGAINPPPLSAEPAAVDLDLDLELLDTPAGSPGSIAEETEEGVDTDAAPDSHQALTLEPDQPQPSPTAGQIAVPITEPLTVTDQGPILESIPTSSVELTHEADPRPIPEIMSAPTTDSAGDPTQLNQQQAIESAQTISAPAVTHSALANDLLTPVENPSSADKSPPLSLEQIPGEPASHHTISPGPTRRISAVNMLLLLLLALVGVSIFYFLVSQRPPNASRSDQFANSSNFENFHLAGQNDQPAASGSPTPQIDNSAVAPVSTTPNQRLPESTQPAALPGVTAKPASAQTAETLRITPDKTDDLIDPAFGLPEPSPSLVIRRVVAPDHRALKQAAQTAFEQGNLLKAEQLYQQWLEQQPTSTGARFGLAKVALQHGNTHTAQSLYLDILALDPQNPAAQASLLTLPGLGSPQSLRRLKALLNQHPGNGYLNYSLGNHQARRGHWQQAQQHYFDAYSAERNNAAYAFNLAIALEHINQPKVAANYYRQALQLTAPPLADDARAQARNRLSQLNAATQ